MPNERKRLEALSEIFESEKSYADDLKIWCEDFLAAMDGFKSLSRQRKYTLSASIFLNMRSILALHKNIIKEISLTNERFRKQLPGYTDLKDIEAPLNIEEIISSNTTVFLDLEYHSIYLKHIDEFNLYITYMTRLPICDHELEKEMNANPLFVEEIRDFFIRNKIPNVDVKHYIYRPTQKLNRYTILLKAIYGREDNENFKNGISELSEKLKAKSVLVNKAYGDIENHFKIFRLTKEMKYAPGIKHKTGLSVFNIKRKILRECEALAKTTRIVEPRFVKVVIFDEIILLFDTIYEETKRILYICDDPLYFGKYCVFKKSFNEKEETTYMKTLSPLYFLEKGGLNMTGLYFKDERMRDTIFNDVSAQMEILKSHINPNIKIQKVSDLSKPTMMWICGIKKVYNDEKEGEESIEENVGEEGEMISEQREEDKKEANEKENIDDDKKESNEKVNEKEELNAEKVDVKKEENMVKDKKDANEEEDLKKNKEEANKEENIVKDKKDVIKEEDLAKDKKESSKEPIPNNINIDNKIGFEENNVNKNINETDKKSTFDTFTKNNLGKRIDYEPQNNTIHDQYKEKTYDEHFYKSEILPTARRRIRSENPQSASLIHEEAAIEEDEMVLMPKMGKKKAPGFFRRWFYGADIFIGGSKLQLDTKPDSEELNAYKYKPENYFLLICTKNGIFKKEGNSFTKISNIVSKKAIFDFDYKILIYQVGEDLYVSTFVPTDTKIVGNCISGGVASFFYGECNNTKYIAIKNISQETSSLVFLFEVQKEDDAVYVSLYRKIYIGSKVSNVSFLKSNLIIACKDFEIIDISTLRTQELVDPLDPYIPYFFFLIDTASAKAIFKVNDCLYLCCYDSVGFFIDNYGNSTTDHTVFVWYCIPTEFRLWGDYIVCVAEDCICIWNIKNGNMIFNTTRKNYKFVEDHSSKYMYDGHAFFELILPDQ